SMALSSSARGRGSGAPGCNRGWPGRAPWSPPAGGRTRSGERSGLCCDLRSLLHPLVQGVDRGGIAAACGRSSLCADPTFHGHEQLVSERAVGGKQIQVGTFSVGDSVQTEEGFASILQCLGITRGELQRALVGVESRVIVAALAIGVAPIVPGFV